MCVPQDPSQLAAGDDWPGGHPSTKKSRGAPSSAVLPGLPQEDPSSRRRILGRPLGSPPAHPTPRLPLGSTAPPTAAQREESQEGYWTFLPGLLHGSETHTHRPTVSGYLVLLLLLLILLLFWVFFCCCCCCSCLVHVIVTVIIVVLFLFYWFVFVSAITAAVVVFVVAVGSC